MNPDQIKSILEKSKTIAVVGCSKNPEKAAHRVPKYLQENGYRIIPVNPSADEILGEKCYRHLLQIDAKVDIVNIFRPSAECYDVVKEAITIKPRVIWMQLGIKDEKAAELARQCGIDVIVDTCMMVAHRQYITE